MPRLSRFFVPNAPLHVIQRGNNRGPIFDSATDFAFFRDCLAHSARKHGVTIHAYVLMTNHVHLLVTPSLTTSLPLTMQAIGRVYVQYFNHAYGRTGTLWEGRYKAAVVDDERYLLTCMRYIETNPVRAHMVARPGDYPWSSYRANACGVNDELVIRHALFERLGESKQAREVAYRDLFQMAIPEETVGIIRDTTQHGWALGSAAFRAKITALSRRAERMPVGRPRRSKAAAV
ncbi:MAG: transposase [Casimicrobiaceae bacterium]